MSWFTHALTLGLALASISALGRRKRIVMVFDVTQTEYHIVKDRARLHEPEPIHCHQRGAASSQFAAATFNPERVASAW